jgi:hypothetical protein
MLQHLIISQGLDEIVFYVIAILSMNEFRGLTFFIFMI